MIPNIDSKNEVGNPVNDSDTASTVPTASSAVRLPKFKIDEHIWFIDDEWRSPLPMECIVIGLIKTGNRFNYYTTKTPAGCTIFENNLYKTEEEAKNHLREHTLTAMRESLEYHKRMNNQLEEAIKNLEENNETN